MRINFGQILYMGKNWRNWRREEDSVTWQLNSRTTFS